MKRIILIVVLVVTAVISYIHKTEGRGKYIPDFARSASQKIHTFTAGYTPGTKTLKMEIDGQNVLQSQSVILRELMYIPSGQHEKIVVKQPGSFSTGVKCGDNQGRKRFDESYKRNNELIRAEIVRITGSS